MDILMLGWELPPRISGGLGNACAGLLEGIEQIGGMKVTFVLPRLFGDEYINQTETISLHALATTSSLNEGGFQKRRYFDSRVLEENCSNATHQSTYDGDLVCDVFEYAKIIGDFDPARIPFDIIHAHDWLTYPAAIGLQQKTKRKLVVHVHSTEIDRAEDPNEDILEIEAAGMRAADKIVAVSEYTKNNLINRYGLDPNKIEVIYNAVGKLTKGESIDDSVNPGDEIVTFLGRVTYQKGPRYFVEAACKVLEQRPRVKFVMGGDGNLLPHMKELVKKKGIEKSFVFPGFLSSEQVFSLLSKSRALVMPSVSEPFGLIAAEAIELLVPVVASSRSGIVEITSGVLSVDPTNANEIALAILSVLGDESLAMELVGRAKAELAALSWRSSAEKLRLVYASTLA